MSHLTVNQTCVYYKDNICRNDKAKFFWLIYYVKQVKFPKFHFQLGPSVTQIVYYLQSITETHIVSTWKRKQKKNHHTTTSYQADSHLVQSDERRNWFAVAGISTHRYIIAGLHHQSWIFYVYI